MTDSDQIYSLLQQGINYSKKMKLQPQNVITATKCLIEQAHGLYSQHFISFITNGTNKLECLPLSPIVRDSYVVLCVQRTNILAYWVNGARKLMKNRKIPGSHPHMGKLKKTSNDSFLLVVVVVPYR